MMVGLRDPPWNRPWAVDNRGRSQRSLEYTGLLRLLTGSLHDALNHAGVIIDDVVDKKNSLLPRDTRFNGVLDSLSTRI